MMEMMRGPRDWILVVFCRAKSLSPAQDDKYTVFPEQFFGDDLS